MKSWSGKRPHTESLQLQVRLAVLDGKRFTTPQHRGGQFPLKAIPVQVESFSKEMGSEPWGVEQLPALPEDPCTGLHPSWEFVNACEAEATAASAASSCQESQLADPACFPDSGADSSAESAEDDAGPVGPSAEVTFW